jgi:ubiquinone/menaquinone biosynthesis C-methylase UbiE
MLDRADASANRPASSGKPFRGLGMEGSIARWYARTTRGSHQDFAGTARRIATRLPQDVRVLEVASGPGYLAIELARAGGIRVDAIDVSRTFVQIASENAAKAGVQVNVRHGDVHALPFDGAIFDLLVCRAAFKNFSRPDVALQEMRRVLKPDGHAVIIDMRRDATNEEIDSAVASMATSRTNAWLIRWTFKGMLRRRAHDVAAFRARAMAAEFRQCDITEDGIGFEAWLRR